MKNPIYALILCTFLLASSGCALFGQPAPSSVQKWDQLVGSVLVYEASAHTQADKEALFVSALTAVGLDLDQLEAVVPSANGILLAQALVKKNPDLAPYADLIAKLYSYAMYGLPAQPTSPTSKSVVEIAPSAEPTP